MAPGGPRWRTSPHGVGETSAPAVGVGDGRARDGRRPSSSRPRPSSHAAVRASDSVDRPTSRPRVAPALQGPQGAQRQQVAGGVVEQLARQRHRPIGAGGGGALGGDAGRHLHQAVEAPPLGPRAGRSVGRQAGHDEARAAARPARPAVAEPAQGAGPVAVHDARRRRRRAPRTRPGRRRRRRSRAHERLPNPTSTNSSSSSSKPGASTRSTSAPHAARKRVATGPAMTRVRSSTRSAGERARPARA